MARRSVVRGVKCAGVVAAAVALTASVGPASAATMPSVQPLEGGGVRLAFDELAPEIERCRGYLVSWHGLLAGFGATLRPDMQCDFTVDPAFRGFRVEFRWG